MEFCENLNDLTFIVYPFSLDSIGFFEILKEKLPFKNVLYVDGSVDCEIVDSLIVLDLSSILKISIKKIEEFLDKNLVVIIFSLNFDENLLNVVKMNFPFIDFFYASFVDFNCKIDFKHHDNDIKIFYEEVILNFNENHTIFPNNPKKFKNLFDNSEYINIDNIHLFDDKTDIDNIYKILQQKNCGLTIHFYIKDSTIENKIVKFNEMVENLKRICLEDKKLVIC